jgi:hypothetical protein
LLVPTTSSSAATASHPPSSIRRFQVNSRLGARQEISLQSCTRRSFALPKVFLPLLLRGVVHQVNWNQAWLGTGITEKLGKDLRLDPEGHIWRAIRHGGRFRAGRPLGRLERNAF